MLNQAQLLPNYLSLRKHLLTVLQPILLCTSLCPNLNAFMHLRMADPVLPPPCPPSSQIWWIYYIQKVNAVLSYQHVNCLHDRQDQMDTTALGAFLNLRLRGNDFRNKLTQYIAMRVIPRSERLVLPNLIKSSVGRWWWYYF